MASPEVEQHNRALVTINAEHHEIHEGDSYFCTYAETLGATATSTYLIVTSAVATHMLFNFDANAQAQFTVYEDSTSTAAGTALTSFNANRNSDNTSILTVARTTASITATGTQIYVYAGGSASAQSKVSTSGRGSEIILKKNSKYLVTCLSYTSTSTLINVKFEWYELE